MLLRRSVIKEIGLFDERFTVYGYDTDLSYRIRLAGYKNYYFPKTFIINTKLSGASQFNWQFVKNFYGAMIIFAVKYLVKMPAIKLQSAPGLPLVYEIE